MEENSGIYEYLTNELNMKGEYLMKNERSKKDGVAIFYDPKKFT